jgi:hypothetical protein
MFTLFFGWLLRYTLPRTQVTIIDCREDNEEEFIKMYRVETGAYFMVLFGHSCDIKK